MNSGYFRPLIAGGARPIRSNGEVIGVVDLMRPWHSTGIFEIKAFYQAFEDCFRIEIVDKKGGKRVVLRLDRKSIMRGAKPKVLEHSAESDFQTMNRQIRKLMHDTHT